jgi:hypothetical protein
LIGAGGTWRARRPCGGSSTTARTASAPCWLALLLIRVAERRTGQTWPALARELGRLHAVTLTGPTGTVTQTTELTRAQQGILSACGLTAPPRITALHPA